MTVNSTALHLFLQLRKFNMTDHNEIFTGKLYVILNLERMTDSRPVFWKADGKGYTDNIFFAGIYDDDGLKRQCIYKDDPVVPISKLPELLRCDMETVNQFIK